MIKIVPYRIAFVSGEDDESPASDLLNPGPSSRGWATDKYCTYPQELGIEFDTRTHIDRIQIIASKLMVSSAIDIFVGDDTNNPDSPEYKKAKFMHLGEIKFNDPVQGKLDGRQMQTIELQGNDELKVSFVKCLLKQNYMHKKNEFNQVSLMGLSVFGVADKPKAGSRRPSRSDDNSIVPRRQDLAFLMYTDKDVAELIHQLEERKYEAVNTEHFDNARKLKLAIDKLIVGGQSLGALEAQKRAFADNQDYNEAKEMKSELEEKREELYRDLEISKLLELPIPPPNLKNVPNAPRELPPPTRVKGGHRTPSNTSHDSGIDDGYVEPRRYNPKPNKPLSKSRRDQNGDDEE